jgi:hypothetical protein
MTLRRVGSTIAVFLSLCVGLASPSGAGTIVLSESFELVAPGTYHSPVVLVPTDFRVQGGSVNVYKGGLCATAGGGATATCVDLEATVLTGPQIGATLTTINTFPAGVYDLSFDLAGSQRGTSETMRLFFGNISGSPISRASADPFQTFSFLGVPVVAGGSFLTFFDDSITGVGPLLDNVTLVRRDQVRVPVPATLLLVVTGLAAVGARLLRRRDA